MALIFIIQPTKQPLACFRFAEMLTFVVLFTFLIYLLVLFFTLLTGIVERIFGLFVVIGRILFAEEVDIPLDGGKALK